MRTRTLVAAAILLLLGVAFVFPLSRNFNSASAASNNQGCINQGNDPRVAATVICWAQRQFSWKSLHRPDFLLIGNPKGANIGLAWPPYLVFNSPAGNGQWHMFRIGFRYDRNWHGYIFPTIAWKLISKPLRY